MSCLDSSHYCGFTLGGYGETGDNVFLEVSSNKSFDVGESNSDGC